MLPRGARHAGTVWEWLEILFQNGIRSHARWSLVKTVTSIILFKCANYWHIIAINTSRTHWITVFSTMHHERCSSNMYKTNSELAFGDHSTRRTRSKIVRWLSTSRGIVFKDAAGETNEGITFFRTAYSSLKLDNIVFHDQKIPETCRARTARNFTK